MFHPFEKIEFKDFYSNIENVNIIYDIAIGFCFHRKVAFLRENTDISNTAEKRFDMTIFQYLKDFYPDIKEALYLDEKNKIVNILNINDILRR